IRLSCGLNGTTHYATSSPAQPAHYRNAPPFSLFVVTLTVMEDSVSKLRGFPTVAALYERRQCSSLDIVGGHRPPLQMKRSHHPKPLNLGVQGLSVVSFAVNANRGGGLK